MTSKTLRLRDEGRVDQVPEGHELISVSLGLDGVVTCAWATPTAREVIFERDTSTGASFPVTRASEPTDLLITATRDSVTAATVVPDFSLAFPHVVRLPSSGDFVAVGSRCVYANGMPEQNAARITSNGDVSHSGTMGDGISHVAADVDDSVWVGYFDEGVFGNFGWGGPSEPEPIGAPGLLRFDADFSIAWTYKAPSVARVDDCYAMNLGPDGLFMCPYSDFPIVQIDGDDLTVWPGKGRPSRLMLVAGSVVALCGGYQTPWNEGVVVNLGSEASAPLKIKGPRSLDWNRPGLTAVSGATLAVVQGRRIFLGRLTD